MRSNSRYQHLSGTTRRHAATRRSQHHAPRGVGMNPAACSRRNPPARGRSKVMPRNPQPTASVRFSRHLPGGVLSVSASGSMRETVGITCPLLRPTRRCRSSASSTMRARRARRDQCHANRCSRADDRDVGGGFAPTLASPARRAALAYRRNLKISSDMRALSVADDGLMQHCGRAHDLTAGAPRDNPCYTEPV